MAPTRKAASITHEELQEAIRRFKKNGGIIQKLPDQKPYGQHAVGSKFAHTEVSTKPDTTV